LDRITYAVLAWQEANETAARAREQIIEATDDAAGWVGYDEVGAMMGVSRQAISQLMRSRGFRQRPRRKK
jgi:hypothetical protein